MRSAFLKFVKTRFSIQATGSITDRPNTPLQSPPPGSVSWFYYYYYYNTLSWSSLSFVPEDEGAHEVPPQSQTSVCRRVWTEVQHSLLNGLLLAFLRRWGFWLKVFLKTFFFFRCWSLKQTLAARLTSYTSARSPACKEGAFYTCVFLLERRVILIKELP